MAYAITVKSRLPVTMRGQLEALLFFNAGQFRMRHAIEATIERFGIPEIIEERVRWQLRAGARAAAAAAADPPGRAPHVRYPPRRGGLPSQPARRRNRLSPSHGAGPPAPIYR